MTKKEIRAIIDIQLAQVHQQLKKQDITTLFTDNLIKLLEERGFDPLFGARPLRRTIQVLILNPLAMDIINGAVHEGDTITIDVHKNAVTIKQKELQHTH